VRIIEREREREREGGFGVSPDYRGEYEFSEGTSAKWIFDVEIEELRAEWILKLHFYISRIGFKLFFAFTSISRLNKIFFCFYIYISAK
jgi:hypothetical protein